MSILKLLFGFTLTPQPEADPPMAKLLYRLTELQLRADQPSAEPGKTVFAFLIDFIFLYSQLELHRPSEAP